jgi:hypothetical protein
VPIPVALDLLRVDERQLPGPQSFAVANELRIAVGASGFEVPVVGRQPRVDNFRDADAKVTKN